jgi:hypothetical protein
MRKSTGLRVLATLAVVGAFALTGGSADATGARTALTCTGGSIASGNYSSITVTGFCDVPADAVVNVTGNIDVADGAVLDAQTDPSTITVGHNVTAGAGSLVGLGCQPASYVGNSGHPCSGTTDPNGHSTITVRGNVTGTDAMAVLLNGITVDGNVTLTGGGSEEIPWSVKNNTVGGNITASGITDEWMGVMFNKVGGNVMLTNITLHDAHPGAPGVYVVENHIGHNLGCFGIDPGVSPGFIPGEHNTVGHKALGQCASLI